MPLWEVDRPLDAGDAPYCPYDHIMGKGHLEVEENQG
jgi:hypothetical protein